MAVILGCGYTGLRVAQRLLAQGLEVIATSRSPSLQVTGALVQRLDVSQPFNLQFVPFHSTVLLSVPSLPAGDPTPEIVRQLAPRKPQRIVYLSTTGVYGAQEIVDELTPPAPRDERERNRVKAEQAVLSGPWSSLVLRPAAIYGPGRGVHVSLPAGRWQLAGDGSNYVSRIHVDDLAAITAAALLRPDVTGAFPVADDEPSTSWEITKFCSELLNVPMPGSVATESVHSTRRSDRRVDGRAIRRLLGIELTYPSFRTGIPASL